MDAGGVESFKKVIRLSSVVVRVLTVSSSDIDQIELFHAVIFPESSTFWGNSRVIYGFTMYFYVNSKVATPAGAKSRTASVVLGRNQPD